MGTPTNLIEINPALWLVRSQAGYRKLSRQVAADNDTVAGRIQGFPTTYPCMVSFTYSHNPAFDLFAKIATVNDWAKQQLRDLMLLAEHDPITKQRVLDEMSQVAGLTKE